MSSSCAPQGRGEAALREVLLRALGHDQVPFSRITSRAKAREDAFLNKHGRSNSGYLTQEGGAGRLPGAAR